MFSPFEESTTFFARHIDVATQALETESTIDRGEIEEFSALFRLKSWIGQDR